MRCLVTGGAGFIGSHLCERLLEQGHEVTVLDNLSSGSRAQIPAPCKLELGDIRDGETVARVMKKVDACFHLAAIASVEVARKDWRLAHSVNLAGTLEIFQAAKVFDVPIVYASSAAVYGDGLPQPLCETMLPRPVSLYGADKLAGEIHAQALTGLRALGLRFFNVYGPRQNPGSPYAGVISLFARKLIAGEQLTIHGDGQQTRDFIHVQDVAAALCRGMDLLVGNETLPPVFNICTGTATSVHTLAATMAEIAGMPPNIVHGTAREGDVRYSCGNPLSAKQFMNLGADITLMQGLGETLRWMQAA